MKRNAQNLTTDYTDLHGFLDTNYTNFHEFFNRQDARDAKKTERQNLARRTRRRRRRKTEDGRQNIEHPTINRKDAKDAEKTGRQRGFKAKLPLRPSSRPSRDTGIFNKPQGLKSLDVGWFYGNFPI